MTITELFNELKWEIMEQKPRKHMLKTVESLEKSVRKEQLKLHDKINGLSEIVKKKQ